MADAQGMLAAIWGRMCRKVRFKEERAGVDKRFVGKNQTFVRAKREKQEREASFKAEGVK